VRPVWRPRDNKIAFFYQKNIQFFSAEIFSQFLVIKTLDSELDPYPDPQVGKMLDPDPH
jgi:hypothetical protein